MSTWRDSRALSAAEFALGAAVVIGHNVFRILPNEVPILFALGLISYRGYLVSRAADLGGRSTPAYWLAVILVAVLFGYGHYYKGPAGVVDSGFAGLILGAAFMLSGRNLWTCILSHGFIDSYAVLAAFLGVDT
jgi:membrane protease YdiL (CAAX protease family)